MIPQINTNIEQIKSFLIKSKQTGVNVVIMDIESKFFAKEGNKYMDILADLFDYFEDEAEQTDLKVEYYSVGEFIKPYMKRDKTI